MLECSGQLTRCLLVQVLLPVVNVPMIDYTLEWLASNDVHEVRTHVFVVPLFPTGWKRNAAEGSALDFLFLAHTLCAYPTPIRQVFVFCCSHSTQVEEYLLASTRCVLCHPCLFILQSKSCV
tara:strand:+ start:1845 stop:2210 length:366 start_codon:yes stop_codon:yes gene_type:complete